MTFFVRARAAARLGRENIKRSSSGTWIVILRTRETRAGHRERPAAFHAPQANLPFAVKNGSQDNE
jgi:hypothetical protein